jgi:hypothetical protein
MKNMNTSDTVSQPAVIARYFEAANRFDSESAAACFTADATVRDEGHTHVGTEAIKNWVSHTSEKYRPQTTVISAREDGGNIAVEVRVAGQFPGSPVELKFQFSLRNDSIAQLTIK